MQGLNQRSAKFGVGNIIRHRLFGYRGVVIDIDAQCEATNDWYSHVALTRPPRDRPWYHVLVHGGNDMTYVAERNLEADGTSAPIEHPLVDAFFVELEDGRYKSAMHHN